MEYNKDESHGGREVLVHPVLVSHVGGVFRYPYDVIVVGFLEPDDTNDQQRGDENNQKDGLKRVGPYQES